MPIDQIPIGKFSHLTRLSKKALHCYDQKGLLVPVAKDLCSGYRYYAIAQIDRAVRIRTLAGLGFSLDEVEAVLDAMDKEETEAIAGLMQMRRRAVRQEIDRLHGVERVLSSADPLKELFKMSLSEWTIKEVAPLRVISTRKKGAYAEVTGPMIERLCQEVALPENRNAMVKVTGTVISICHAGDENGSDCDIEVALPVAGAVTVRDPGVEVRRLPGCQVLSVLYQGPHENLPRAHRQVREYLDAHALHQTGPEREVYLNDPAESAAADLMTEIQYPVED
ncbi:effector-binding domain-containing protein [Methanofollis sp. W23]|uniref:MerR family transcriptional regulator n=1 Tax=Methanofollis sp. W23 TaxID=2817849 RepID=UPI001AE54BA8|nr:MerR family transcriptional regulator [Methanofollis sp. W23]MBP2144616.1 effector-binding domain-containing protein [Methanofollis sp. W23]